MAAKEGTYCDMLFFVDDLHSHQIDIKQSPHLEGVIKIATSTTSIDTARKPE